MPTYRTLLPKSKWLGYLSRLHKIGKQNPNLGSSTDNGEDGCGGSGDYSPDMTAIVSALANQQSEEEEEDEDSSQKRHLVGGGGEGSLESIDASSMHFVPKDLHNLSRMFIQANLLPRPRSESNFQVGTRMTLVPYVLCFALPHFDHTVPSISIHPLP